MTTIAEIEAAIEKLPDAQVAQLACWLQTLRQLRTTPSAVDEWLNRARGAAIPGATTDDLQALTRGEECAV